MLTNSCRIVNLRLRIVENIVSIPDQKSSFRNIRIDFVDECRKWLVLSD